MKECERPRKMARSDAFCKSDQFYCYSLGQADETDEQDIIEFEPVNAKGSDFVAYLQRRSFVEEHASLMRTYPVRDNDTDELAGYFSLRAGLVIIDESETDDGTEFDTLPGVELANFAVNGKYRRAHPLSRGCGMSIFYGLVLETIRRAATLIGVTVVYLYSLPDTKVIANYRSYGFSRLPEQREKMVHARLKPRYDSQCIFMYMAIDGYGE